MLTWACLTAVLLLSNVLLCFTKQNVQTLLFVLSPVTISVHPSPRCVDQYGHSSLLHK